MSIGQLIKRKPVTAQAGDTLAKAASLMEEERVGAVIVTEDGKLRGIITDRDLAIATCVRGLTPNNAIATVMTRPVFAIADDEGVLDATRKMMEHAVRRLPILDQEGCVVGMVSADDLVPLLSHELNNIVYGIQGAVAQ